MLAGHVEGGTPQDQGSDGGGECGNFRGFKESQCNLKAKCMAVCARAGDGGLGNRGVHYKAQRRETKFKRQSGTGHKTFKMYNNLDIILRQWGPAEGLSSRCDIIRYEFLKDHFVM